MATDIQSSDLGLSRLTGAANGVSLSTTADFVPLPQGTKYVDLIPRNFATAVVYRYIECPYLLVYVTTDALASAPFDYSQNAQDGSTATSVVLSGLPTLANGGAIWMASTVPYRGVDLDVDAPNGTASNLTVHYPAASSLTLTDISDTDNTDTGASLAQDGTVTWTIPTAPVWTAASLRAITAANGIPMLARSIAHDTDLLYWTRWTWNAAMDAATTLDHMLAMNESTAYAERPTGAGLERRVNVGLGGASGFELLTNAGTGNLLVNCHTLSGGRFTTGTANQL
jgi:hypothetical protein